MAPAVPAAMPTKKIAAISLFICVPLAASERDAGAHFAYCLIDQPDGALPMAAFVRRSRLKFAVR